MLGALRSLLRARYAAPALALLGAYGAYQLAALPAPELEPEKRRAADAAAALLAEAMPEDWRGKKLFVAPFERDGSGYVTRAVRRAILRLDGAELVAPPAGEGALPDPRVKRAPDKLSMLKAAGGAGAELLMLGKVEELSLEGGAPRVSLAVEVLDVKTASRLWEEAVSWRPGFLARTVGQVSPVKRAAGWILFVLLLPWAALPVVRRVLKRESNAANAALLCALLAVSAALAYLALAGELSGWGGALFLIACSLGFFYNAGVLNRVAGFGD